MFPAGELVAHTSTAFIEPRKKIPDGIQCPSALAGRAGCGGCEQIFLYGEVGRDQPTFRYQGNAAPCDAIGGKGGNRLPAESDAAPSCRCQPHNGANGGCLAHAVAPHQSDDFAFLDGERHAEQYLALAIKTVDVLHFQNHVMSPPRDRPHGPVYSREFPLACPWRWPGHRQAP